jgi:hypothetical protein
MPDAGGGTRLGQKAKPLHAVCAAALASPCLTLFAWEASLSRGKDR